MKYDGSWAEAHDGTLSSNPARKWLRRVGQAFSLRRAFSPACRNLGFSTRRPEWPPQAKGLPHRLPRLLVFVAEAALVLFCAGWALTHHGHSSGLMLSYVGPGAGFAFLGSFLSLLTGFFLGAFSLLSWPFRIVWRMVRRRGGFRNAKVKKVIFLGMDGLDPKLAERFMAEGKLPNLSRLREQGSYSRLRTTFPALSPVAWSTFATGVNPARHNIFDFLNRNTKSYVPELAAAKVHSPSRVLKLGRFRIPLSKAHVELRRRSQPFWKLLGQQQIGSTIIRVPITFPPEKFNGRMLSAMSTPDLRGTQGSFSQFTTRIGEVTFESGSRYPLRKVEGWFEGLLDGPEDVLIENGGAMQIPFRMEVNGGEPALKIRGCLLSAEARNVHALGEAEVQIGGACQRERHCAVPAHRVRSGTLLAVLFAGADRPGKAGAANQPSIVLRGLSVETAGHVLDARHGRGYVGAERRRDRRRRLSEAVVSR